VPERPGASPLLKSPAGPCRFITQIQVKKTNVGIQNVISPLKSERPVLEEDHQPGGDDQQRDPEVVVRHPAGKAGWSDLSQMMPRPMASSHTVNGGQVNRKRNQPRSLSMRVVSAATSSGRKAATPPDHPGEERVDDDELRGRSAVRRSGRAWPRRGVSRRRSRPQTSR